MKKLIAALITVTMLAGIVAMFPASATNAENIDIVEVEYFDVKPYIDAYVTEEEWGEPTVHAIQANASTVDDRYPDIFFFGRNYGARSQFITEEYKMEWYMWLRWDEEYFYIAAKVYDPDGHSLKNGKTDTWNGDAFQVRIDPLGANAIVDGEDFDALNDSADHKPWGDTRVCDFVFGFCEKSGGFPEAYENTSGKGMTSYSNNPLGHCDPAISTAGTEYTEDTENGITTYEIAVPWAFVDGWTGKQAHQYKKYSSKEKAASGPDGLIGVEYGMSAVVLNANGENGDSMWNAFLNWGSGICSLQQEKAVKTCAGSNAIIFSAKKVSEDGFYTGEYEKYTLGGPEITESTVHYDTEINKSLYSGKLTYTNSNDMRTFGTSQRGRRIKDSDGNWVLDFSEDIYGELNTQNYLQAGYRASKCSFTYEFDVKFTGVSMFENGYNSELYHWFGGGSQIDFQCGYSYEDGVFFLRENNKEDYLLTVEKDIPLNEWHHWVFQYDNESCTMRFYFDPEINSEGRVSASAQPVFIVRNRYFDYSGLSSVSPILRRMNVQIQMDNVEFYNFVDFTTVGPHDCEFLAEDEDWTVIAVPTATTEGRIAKICPKCGKYCFKTTTPAFNTLEQGDANFDGEVTMSDILLIRRYVDGIPDEYDCIHTYYCNIDRNNDVSMSDVLLARRIVAGIE